VQISIQSPDAEENDRIAGNRSYAKKLAAARHARELDFPLTINCVLHRQNLDRIEELLDLTLELGAQRLELANTQYYGWAVPNQAALMPSPDQLRRAEDAVQRFRARVGPKVDVLWVLPDFYGELPKPCMGGWGRVAMVVAPNGDVLPCQAAATIPGLEFANVREHPLEWIWNESDAFARFRGTEWMQEPCRTCPLGRQEEDWGGCRCQALRLAGDAAATDPVCRFSPHHDRVVAAREPARTDEFVYRTMKRPRVPS
jgi:PqqA peptide cyclase